jgi:esterase/lipase superfamily enzyme
VVVLAAPDIDIDVFKSQMRRFGKPRKPFFIIVSHDDKVLRFSDFIAGGKQRLGASSLVC